MPPGEKTILSYASPAPVRREVRLSRYAALFVAAAWVAFGLEVALSNQWMLFISFAFGLIALITGTVAILVERTAIAAWALLALFALAALVLVA
jgi:hypothetical protein